MFQTKYNLPLTDLTQKLSQPVLDSPQNHLKPWRSDVFPLYERVQIPLPLFEISLLIDSTLYLTGRWLWWGRCERRRIPQSPVLKQLGKTTETLATLCVYPWHCVNGFEVSKFPALNVSPAAIEPPCRKLSWAALHDLNKNWAKPAKCGDFCWRLS